ncbi:MAG: hypothetical protein DMF84_07625 [Acidobacteria bacterium]|nr:MAG: hypothetical protein DMF84_07625 [Acidobacteriota bacterium]
MQAKDAHHSSRKMRASDGGLIVTGHELRMASQPSLMLADDRVSYGWQGSRKAARVGCAKRNGAAGRAAAQ